MNGTNMVGFIKTSDPDKFNFGHFFSSLIASSPFPLPLSGGGINFEKMLPGEN